MGNGISTGLLNRFPIEKDTDYSIYELAGSKNLYGKSWFRVEKRGFPDGAEQKRFRESVALYKKNRVAKHIHKYAQEINGK